MFILENLANSFQEKIHTISQLNINNIFFYAFFIKCIILYYTYCKYFPSLPINSVYDLQYTEVLSF